MLTRCMSSGSARSPLTDTDTSSLPRARSAPRTTRARLTAVFPRELTWEIAVAETPIALGRGDSVGAPGISHATVSRAHATITWSAELGVHLLVDGDSRNGSAVDGATARPGAPVVLKHDAVVRIGDVLLVYERHPALGSADPHDETRELVPGEAATIRAVRAAIARAAPDPSPILVEGETGTGKEFVVRELHRRSGAGGKLVPLNCAALPRELAESTLFGHVRGAFTGASTDHPGVFRAAQDGTLFLDEIGELELELQAKLLRAVQERVVTPVGATTGLPVAVRVIAATNRSLAREVEARRFRRDLYARLAMWRIQLPPLRERRRDVLDWLDRLHARWCAARGTPPTPLELTSPAAELLLLHPWPDNLRGLDRLVHMLSVLDPHPIQADEVARELAADAAPTPARPHAASTPAAPATAGDDGPRRPRRQAPPEHEMRRLFDEAGGRVARLARTLGVERRQVYRWLDAYGMRDASIADADDAPAPADPADGDGDAPTRPRRG